MGLKLQNTNVPVMKWLNQDGLTIGTIHWSEEYQEWSFSPRFTTLNFYAKLLLDIADLLKNTPKPEKGG